MSLAKDYKKDDKELTDELKSAQTKWKERFKERSPEAIDEYNDNMKKGYFVLVAFLAPVNMANFQNYYFIVMMCGIF